jgi:hypothetical protein
MAMALLLTAPLAAAAEQLSASGAKLEDVSVSLTAPVSLSRSIALDGDSPSAFYVMAHMPDGRSLQRNNLGYWVPWDGRPQSLIDNRFSPNGGQVTYKILRQNIGHLFFPVTITLAYRAGGAIKFGVFNLLPEQ